MASKRKRKRSVRLVDQNFPYDLTDIASIKALDNNNYVDNLEMLQKGNNENTLGNRYTKEDSTQEKKEVSHRIKCSDEKNLDISTNDNVTERELCDTDSDISTLNSSYSDNNVITLNQITDLGFTITTNPDYEEQNDDDVNFEENENPVKKRKGIEDNCRKRRPRTVFNEMQSEYLSAIYQIKEVLDWNERNRISKLLNLSDFNVKTWFKNGRRVSKKDSHWAITHMEMARSFQNKFNVLPDFNVVCKLCESYIDDYEMLEIHWMGKCQNKSKINLDSTKQQPIEKTVPLMPPSLQNKSFMFDSNKEVVIPPIIHVPKMPQFPLSQPQMNNVYFGGVKCVYPSLQPLNLSVTPPVQLPIRDQDRNFQNTKQKRRRKSIPHKLIENQTVEKDCMFDISAKDMVEMPKNHIMPCFPEPIEIVPNSNSSDTNLKCNQPVCDGEENCTTVKMKDSLDFVKTSDMWHIPIDISSDEMNEDSMDDEQKIQISKLTETAVPGKQNKVVGYINPSDAEQFQNKDCDFLEQNNTTAIDIDITETKTNRLPITTKDISDNNKPQSHGKSLKQRKRNRITFNDIQISVLSALFETTQWLAVPEVELFANLLQLSFSNVKVWFKNTRRLNQIQDNSKRVEMAAKFYDKFYLFPDLSIKCKHCENFILCNDTLADHWDKRCTKLSIKSSPAPVMNIARKILGRKGPPNRRTPKFKEHIQTWSNITKQEYSAQALMAGKHHASYPPIIDIETLTENLVPDLTMVNSTTKVIEIKPVELDVLPDNNIISLNAGYENNFTGIAGPKENNLASDEVNNIYSSGCQRNVNCTLSKPLDLSNANLADVEGNEISLENTKYDNVTDIVNSSSPNANPVLDQANDNSMLKIVNVFSVTQQTELDQRKQSDCTKMMETAMSDSFNQLTPKFGKIMTRKPPSQKKHPFQGNLKLNHLKRNRTTFPKIKTAVLSAVFEKNGYPIYNNTLHIAKTLDLTYDTIKLWFKNMRQLYRSDEKGVKRRSQMAVSALENINISDDLRTFCNKCGNEINSYSVLERHWRGSCK